MSRSASPTAVGAFVVAALTLLAGSIIAIGGTDFFTQKDRFSIFFGGSVNGLTQGSAVKLDGVEVGKVLEIRALALAGEEGLDVRTETIIEIDASKFERLGDEISEEDRAQDLIDSGLRAQLSLESLLTGQLYVALQMLPEEPAVLVGAPGKYDELPAMPTAFEELQANAREVLGRIGQLPLEEIVQHLNSAVEGVDRLVSDPALPEAMQELKGVLTDSRTAVADLRRTIRDVDGQVERVSGAALTTLEEVRASIASVAATVETGSPLSYQLSSTLQEVSEAARAVRGLANTLERNPSAVVFGRAAGEE